VDDPLHHQIRHQHDRTDGVKRHLRRRQLDGAAEQRDAVAQQHPDGDAEPVDSRDADLESGRPAGDGDTVTGSVAHEVPVADEHVQDL